VGAYFERAKLGRMSRESAGTFQLGSLSFSMGGVMLILSQEWFPQKNSLKLLKVDGQQNKNWTVFMNQIRNRPILSLSINMQPIKSDKFIMKMKVTKRLVTENKINGPYDIVQILGTISYGFI